MMFHVGGILPLLVALAMWVALPESPAFLAARDSASPQPRLIAGRIAGERFVVAEQRADKLPVRELFTSGRLAVTLALWVAFFGAFGMLNVVVSWTPAAGAASVISFSNLAVVIGIGPAGQLVSRFGAGLTLVPALVLAALATWLMSQVQSTAQASAVTMPFGLSLGCGAPGLIAIATTFYGTRMRGTGIGWGMAMGRFVQVIGQLMQFVAVVPIAVAGAVLAARAFAKRSTVAAQVEAAQPSS